MKKLMVTIVVLFGIAIIAWFSVPRSSPCGEFHYYSEDSFADEADTLANDCKRALGDDNISPTYIHSLSCSASSARQYCKSLGQGNIPESKKACANLHLWCNKWYR